MTVQTRIAERRAAQECSCTVRNAVGILISRFPLITEAFVLREINELERQGQPLVLIPLLRQKTSVMHEEAKPWLSRALYTPFFSLAVVRSNVGKFLERPRAYIATLARLIAGSILHPKTLARHLALFPKSVHLADILPRQGIRHVHAHFATSPTTAALIISSLSNITFSFTVHASDIFLHRILLREKIEAAKFVRAVSNFNKAFLHGLYPETAEGKIEVVHVGIEPELYARAAAARQPANRPRILCVASLRPFKGLPYLIEACSKLRDAGVDFECRIVGRGPIRSPLAHMIAERELEGYVQLVGALPQHEVAQLMGQSDIFVLPSMIARNGLMDGIPISLMEAMAAGRPVIASALSGIPELVQHGVSGILVDATNSDQLADAIQALIDDPALRDAMGRQGMQKVASEFHLARCVSQFLELLDPHSRAESRVTDRLVSVDWTSLRIGAVGIRRVHERRDSTVAEIITTGDGLSGELVLKQQRTRPEQSRPAAERARHEFETMLELRRTLSAASFDLDDGIEYSVPLPIHFEPGAAHIIMQRARGGPLDQMIRDVRSDPPVEKKLADALTAAGTWLRLFQRPDQAGDPLMALDEIGRTAHQDLELAAAGDGQISRARAQILKAMGALSCRLASRRLRLAGHHGDFWPGNIFIAERSVEVIDFEGFRPGLPLEDVAYFLVQLELFFAYPILHRAFRPLEKHFLTGYAAARKTEIDLDALRLFRIAKGLQILSRGMGDAPGGARAAFRRRMLHRIIVGSAS